MKLDELRKQRNLKQKEVARQLICSPSVICLYEKGKSYPRRQRRIRLSKILNITEHELLESLDETELYFRKEIKNVNNK